ncbi:hypothetical protein [Methylocystis bryophila]
MPIILRRRPLTASIAACALAAALGAAQAEDSEPLSNRMMQMLGLGAGQQAPASETAAPPAAPPQSAPPPPPQAEESRPLTKRMMQMFGLGGDNGAPASTPATAPARRKDEPDEPRKTSRVLRMLGLVKGAQDPEEVKAKREIVECPDIVVDGAGAEMRSPPGADASSVAYQISITRMARECALDAERENVSLRVGLLGAAMLGPAGKPGGYFGSLRVALRRKSDNEVLGEKTYRVGATIPANQSRADFTLLVEDFTAPFVNSKAAEDYEILVGFAGAAKNEGGAKKPHKHGG